MLRNRREGWLRCSEVLPENVRTGDLVSLHFVFSKFPIRAGEIKNESPQIVRSVDLEV